MISRAVRCSKFLIDRCRCDILEKIAMSIDVVDVRLRKITQKTTSNLKDISFTKNSNTESSNTTSLASD